MKNILYIVDDHNMVRNGLKAWLELHTDWRVPKDFGKISRNKMRNVFYV